MLKEEKPKRGGGRAARRAARVDAPTIHKPTLIRNIPTYEIVNQEGVELVHDMSMRIVEEVGVDFRCPESLAIWKQAGADIQGERVRVPRELLMSLIEQAPSEYVHHGRNAERTVKVGNEHMVFSPSYGPAFVIDLDGVRRYATMEDLDNFQKINHMASAVHIAGGPMVEPMDIPVPYRHLHMAYSAFKYSDKPIIGAVTAGERAQDTLDMAKLVFGDEFVQNNAVTTSLINSTSPLVWDKTMLDSLRIYAANNQAVMCSPFSMAGASTPASNVGTVAVVTAEALTCIALAQLVRAGSPMLYGVPAMTVALNTGAPVHGCPDSALTQILSGMMARYYKLPHRAIMNVSTAKIPDMYAGYDSMWGAFGSVLAGANWITHAGGNIEGALTQSYGKTIIDYEQTEAFYHFASGLHFEDMDEVFATIKDVGPGNHYLGAAHTRKNQLHILPLQHNNTFEQWEIDGRLNADAVGIKEAKRRLERYELPELNPAIDEAMLDFINRREGEISPNLL